MSKYDVEMKYRHVKKALKKLGLDYKHAGDHDTATCPETNQKTTVPRHSEIDKFVVGSIIEFLIANDYPEDKVLEAFKLK